jgi:hypothetical protein
MLSLVQHLIKSMAYETLKRVQGDVLRVLGQPHASYFDGSLCRARFRAKAFQTQAQSKQSPFTLLLTCS